MLAHPMTTFEIVMYSAISLVAFIGIVYMLIAVLEQSEVEAKLKAELVKVEKERLAKIALKQKKDAEEAALRQAVLAKRDRLEWSAVRKEVLNNLETLSISESTVTLWLWVIIASVTMTPLAGLVVYLILKLQSKNVI